MLHGVMGGNPVQLFKPPRSHSTGHHPAFEGGREAVQQNRSAHARFYYFYIYLNAYKVMRFIMAFSQTLEKHPRNSKAGTMLGRGAGERRRESRAAGEIAAFPMAGPGPRRGGYGVSATCSSPRKDPRPRDSFVVLLVWPYRFRTNPTASL